VTKDDLSSLNRYKLYLKEFFLSDITNGYGTMVTDDAWMGRYHEIPWHSPWPEQAPPTRHDWVIWRNFIKRCFLSRGMHLKQTLGKWFGPDDKWPWYYSTDYDCLYNISDKGCLEFSRIHHCSHCLVFTKNGIPTNRTSKLYHAMVFSKGHQRICSGFDEIQINQPIVTQILWNT
jgi:hypothetical protein